jgi:putative MATE family efflux protein
MADFNKIIQTVRKSLNGEEQDYTKGSIRMAIVLLAIPMILELCLESVFAVVDMYFVGKLPNANAAIATVGLTESVISLVFTLGIGLSIGVTAIVSRRIGEKNPEEASKAGAQAIIVSVFLSILIAILGIYFAENILALMGAKPEVIEQGKMFTKILMGSSPAIILLFMINGIFRGAGDASMSMKSLWIASGINIILCPVFIFGFGPIPALGLTGAAVATTIGRSSGVLFQCYHLFSNKRSIKMLKEYFIIDWNIIKNLLNVAFPATLQFFIQSGSWIFLAYLVATTGGTLASAGYQIAIRNIVFFILPAWGLSNAAATLVGQNLGAKETQRAEDSVLLTAKYSGIFMAVVAALFIFVPRFIVGLFTADEAVMAFGIESLRIVGYGTVFFGVGMVLQQALNGAGDTKTPTWINVVSFWVIQVPMAWILAVYFKMGPTGVFWAIPVADAILTIAAWYFFKKGKWKTVEV